MQAAVALVALSLAYAVYLLHSGLARRVRLDQVRLRGLFGRGQVRLRAFNIVLYWFFFVTMTALLVSGGLLYFGLFAGNDVAMLHWYGDVGDFRLRRPSCADACQARRRGAIAAHLPAGAISRRRRRSMPSNY